MSSGLQVQVSNKDDKTIVVNLVGRADSETYTQLEKELNSVVEQGPSKVLVDMQQCNYVSSAAIRVLFDFRKGLREKMAVVSFFNLQPQIRKVFEIVKALPLECIFSSVEEADAYLERMMAEEIKKQSEGNA